MANLRREVGFLGALSSSSFGSLLWPEGTIALVVGIGGGCRLLSLATVEQRVELVRDSLQLLGVLLGVVFAAFALLIALFNEDYVKLLQNAQRGVLAFFRPFTIAIGVQVVTVFLALAYTVAAPLVDSRLEVGAFLAWAFLFSFSMADVVALTRSVALHGYTRARQIAGPESGGSVRPLRDKSG